MRVNKFLALFGLFSFHLSLAVSALTINLNPASHDPAGFTILVDGSAVCEGQPPFDVNTDGLAPGKHTLTVRCKTFPDLEDASALYVIKVGMSPVETNVCWTEASSTLHLTWTPEQAPSESVNWSVSPSTGLTETSKNNTSFVFSPTDSTPGEYTVTAASSVLPNCTTSCVVRVVKADLALLGQDGQEIDETLEESDGEVIQVNIDDDDNDAGNGSSLVPDKDDVDGVSGENDLVTLRLKSVLPYASDVWRYKLHFPPENIAVWRNANKTQAVISDTTEFLVTEDSTVYVEGVRSSAGFDGELITLRLYMGSQLFCEDRVKICVAQTVFAIFGDGATGEAPLRAYVAEKKKDCRVAPYIIKGGTSWFAVHCWSTAKLAKLALELEDGYVVYDGHSNFGIGFAFSKDITAIQAFMNVGEPLLGIDWQYMRTHQQANFWIEDCEYADDVTSTVAYDPWIMGRYVVGVKQTLSDIGEFLSSPYTGAEHLSLFRGQSKYQDYHTMQGISYIIGTVGGSADMPNKRWKKLFLNSCFSGGYYYRIFDHGTLFYTIKDCGNVYTTREFIKAVIEGKSDEGIWQGLEAFDEVHDYRSF